MMQLQISVTQNTNWENIIATVSATNNAMSSMIIKTSQCKIFEIFHRRRMPYDYIQGTNGKQGNERPPDQKCGDR